MQQHLEGHSATMLGILSHAPTPIVEFRLGAVQLLAKLEYLLPTMSIKYRIAQRLVDELVASGKLTQRTQWVVEATAGNTALALTHVLKKKGFGAQVVAVVSDKVQSRKIERMKASGIVVEVVPYQVGLPSCGRGSPLIEALYATASRLKDAVVAGQFFSEENVRAHEFGTGAEIVKQLASPPDAIVCGAGTGGTITGVARAMKRFGWRSKIVLADPQGSVIGSVWKGKVTTPGKSIVEGIGSDFVTDILDLGLIDEVVTVSDDESLAAVKQLSQVGFPVGTSSGCAVAACQHLVERDPTISRCLVFFADHGVWYDS